MDLNFSKEFSNYRAMVVCRIFFLKTWMKEVRSMELLFGLSLLTKLSLMRWRDFGGSWELEDGNYEFCFGLGAVVVNELSSMAYWG
jgi:hypothetical protein